MQAWRHGDNALVAREMETLFKIKVTRRSVRLWQIGETQDSKLEQFYLDAARSVQEKRRAMAGEMARG